MIDYCKISIINPDIEHLLKLDYLDFKVEVSERTGLFSRKKVANYYFSKITVIDDRIVLFTGSIHKLWNALNNIKAPNYKTSYPYKGYNGNLFNYNEIIEVRLHLALLFNCQPNQMIFQNIELGINTTPNFNPNLYINGLLYHRNKPFEFRFNRHFAQVFHQRYILKIYNKSNQYGMRFNVLRVELKLLKAIEIDKIGIVSFEDINEHTLENAKMLLLRRFKEVVYFDHTIRPNSFNQKGKDLLKDYSNQVFWLDTIKSNHRDRHKKRLNEIILNHSDNLSEEILNSIEQKCVMINQVLTN